MLNLGQTQKGRFYRVTWMLGDVAQYMKVRCGLREESVVYILQNRKGGWVVFSVNGMSYGISPDAAFSVKVEPL